MFIEQGIRSENKFWKYLLGSVFIITASVVGQIPLVIAVMAKIFLTGATYPTTNEGIMHFFEPNLTFFLLLISFVFALAGISFVVKYLHQQTMLSVTTSRKKVDWNRIFFSFGLWAVFSVVSTLVFYFFNPTFSKHYNYGGRYSFLITKGLVGFLQSFNKCWASTC